MSQYFLYPLKTKTCHNDLYYEKRKSPTCLALLKTQLILASERVVYPYIYIVLCTYVL